MPEALTELQKEHLDFIHTFIQENECAPRLEEIAKHFGVTSPTAHKALRSLQDKGYLYFGRDNVTGFYIRLIEFVDISIQVSEISMLGSVDQYGIVHNFPKKTGHFVTPTLQSNQKDLFALHVSGHLPEFSFVPHDIIIFDQDKTPQVGDICLTIINNHRVLVQIMDEDQENDRLSWMTLDEDNASNPVLLEDQETQNTYPQYLPTEFIIATALRITRHLAF
jgi:SOS-response transcriptional repressor LexA